jgi:hypothetical protein
MTAVLLANVGNSDLVVTDPDLLPSYERGRLPSRLMGEAILDDFDRFRGKIELPLIEPAIDWICEYEDLDPKDIILVLFASDQPEKKTNPSARLKDTKPVAEAIVKHLNDRFKIGKKQIKIQTIDGSPADYSNALNFYQNTLKDVSQWINQKIDNPSIYLEVSGGTPAMTSMLIVMGVETFGQDVTTLYLDRASKSPYRIDISQALFARKNRETLLGQVKLHAYNAAYVTMIENGQLLLSDDKKRKLVEYLLHYGDRRLAFDYDRARTSIREAQALAVGTMQTDLRYWQRELKEASIETKIAELIHSAEIKAELGEYSDLTQRLFRFQESIFRHLAEDIGIQYSKPDGMRVKSSWYNSQQDLQQYLENYRRNAKGQVSDNVISVDLARTLNRFSLGAYVEFNVQQTPWQHLQNTIENIFKLSSVADLRNKGISGHGFDGIGEPDLINAYGGDVHDIIVNMKEIFTTIFDKSIDDNPYEELNRLIRDLIGEQT